MKCTVRLLALLVLLPLLFVGCNDPQTNDPEPVYYTVTFDSNGGSSVSAMTAESGKTIPEPEEPTRENYIFDGWYHGTEKWVFSYHNVKENITLKASWRSADYVFGYASVEGTDEAILTNLKSEHATLLVPETINGFRVVGIGEGTFAELSSDTVKKIILPASVTRIGDEAFANSAGIEILVGGALTEVGEKAFLGCDGLKKIQLAEGLTRISADAFSSTGLSHVILPSTLDIVEENAFADCTSLRTIVLHNTIADTDAIFSVEDSAFRDCEGLKTVFLYGTEADKTAILKKTDYKNDAFRDATFCYYSETEPTAEGNYWYMHKGEARVW